MPDRGRRAALGRRSSPVSNRDAPTEQARPVDDLDGVSTGSAGVSPGTVQIRPLGGAVGCLLMIVISVIASVVLTVVVNVVLR
jgi:hypothetical protein